ncbi:MAG: hypothetical protein V7K41_21795 [Nostoc sp.]|uniref:hypothetical protein n=1 Tax=Nostoc sp. TaxID=1180 RepID=UPI002FFADEB0
MAQAGIFARLGKFDEMPRLTPEQLNATNHRRLYWTLFTKRSKASPDYVTQCDRLRWAVTRSQKILLNNCNNI